MTRRGSTLLTVGMLILAVCAPAAAASPTLAEIEDEVMCTVCGVPLSMAREAPAAKRERALIAELIAQGKTKAEIKDELVATYGDTVLAVPPKRGFDLVAWLVPVTAVIIGIGLLGWLLVAWRRRPPGGDDVPSHEPLDPDDAARVDAALAERD